jgi:chemotaxis protein CheX
LDRGSITPLVVGCEFLLGHVLAGASPGIIGRSAPEALPTQVLMMEMSMPATLSLRGILLDSAKEVFDSMVFLALEEVEEGTPNSESVTFLGTITFMGSIEGCLSVCFSQACARDIAAGMLCMGSPEALGDDDIVDAVGEIANMVMGAVKTRLQGSVETISISIPSVIQGRQLRRRPRDGTVRIDVHVRAGQTHAAEFSLFYGEVDGGSGGAT